jgi:hypothetical protein
MKSIIPARRAAVAERANYNVQSISYPGVSPDAAGDVGVCSEVLDRVQARVRRHCSGHP